MLTIASLTSILAIAAMGYQLRAFAQSTEASRAHSLAVFISNLAQDFDFFISKTAPSLSPNFNKIISKYELNYRFQQFVSRLTRPFLESLSIIFLSLIIYNLFLNH